MWLMWGWPESLSRPGLLSMQLPPDMLKTTKLPFHLLFPWLQETAVHTCAASPWQTQPKRVNPSCTQLLDTYINAEGHSFHLNNPKPTGSFQFWTDSAKALQSNQPTLHLSWGYDPDPPLDWALDIQQELTLLGSSHAAKSNDLAFVVSIVLAVQAHTCWLYYRAYPVQGSH